MSDIIGALRKFSPLDTSFTRKNTQKTSFKKSSSLSSLSSCSKASDLSKSQLSQYQLTNIHSTCNVITDLISQGSEPSHLNQKNQQEIHKKTHKILAEQALIEHYTPQTAQEVNDVFIQALNYNEAHTIDVLHIAKAIDYAKQHHNVQQSRTTLQRFIGVICKELFKSRSKTRKLANKAASHMVRGVLGFDINQKILSDDSNKSTVKQAKQVDEVYQGIQSASKHTMLASLPGMVLTRASMLVASIGGSLVGFADGAQTVAKIGLASLVGSRFLGKAIQVNLYARDRIRDKQAIYGCASYKTNVEQELQIDHAAQKITQSKHSFKLLQEQEKTLISDLISYNKNVNAGNITPNQQIVAKQIFKVRFDEISKNYTVLTNTESQTKSALARIEAERQSFKRVRRVGHLASTVRFGITASMVGCLKAGVTAPLILPLVLANGLISIAELAVAYKLAAKDAVSMNKTELLQTAKNGALLNRPLNTQKLQNILQAFKTEKKTLKETLLNKYQIVDLKNADGQVLANFSAEYAQAKQALKNETREKIAGANLINLQAVKDSWTNPQNLRVTNAKKYIEFKLANYLYKKQTALKELNALITKHEQNPNAGLAQKIIQKTHECQINQTYYDYKLNTYLEDYKIIEEKIKSPEANEHQTIQNKNVVAILLHDDKANDLLIKTRKFDYDKNLQTKLKLLAASLPLISAMSAVEVATSPTIGLVDMDARFGTSFALEAGRQGLIQMAVQSIASGDVMRDELLEQAQLNQKDSTVGQPIAKNFMQANFSNLQQIKAKMLEAYPKLEQTEANSKKLLTTKNLQRLETQLTKNNSVSSIESSVDSSMAVRQGSLNSMPEKQSINMAYLQNELQTNINQLKHQTIVTSNQTHKLSNSLINKVNEIGSENSFTSTQANDLEPEYAINLSATKMNRVMNDTKLTFAQKTKLCLLTMGRFMRMPLYELNALHTLAQTRTQRKAMHSNMLELENTLNQVGFSNFLREKTA